MLSKYRKTVAAVVGAGLTWATVVTQSPSQPVTAAEWVAGGILLATAGWVLALTNKDDDLETADSTAVTGVAHHILVVGN